jgi:hypothetical protein
MAAMNAIMRGPKDVLELVRARGNVVGNGAASPGRQ